VQFLVEKRRRTDFLHTPFKKSIMAIALGLDATKNNPLIYKIKSANQLGEALKTNTSNELEPIEN